VARSTACLAISSVRFIAYVRSVFIPLSKNNFRNTEGWNKWL
jgi:hypothetical protein